MWLPFLALSAIKDDAILHSGLYQLDKVHYYMDADITIDGYDTRKMVSDVIHVYLEDVLAHLQAKGQVQEPVPSFVSVECCQI